MCTVINQTTGRHLFGRTLDLAYNYCEEVVVTPRGYGFSLAHQGHFQTTIGIMGIAHVVAQTPLYYDAVNECGLCMAALNFPDFAAYHPPTADKYNIASFELIPWILGQCKDTAAALCLLKETNITPHAFSPKLPPTPLHWMLSDAQTSVVMESTETGLHLHPNPVHVMTNAPTFPQQLEQLDNAQKEHHIPGDLSSTSRFIRGVYANTHTCQEDTYEGAVCRFFHVMDMVFQPKGCTTDDQGRPVCTQYTSCGDPWEMTYHVSTYQNRCICCIQAKEEHLTAKGLSRFPMTQENES